MLIVVLSLVVQLPFALGLALLLNQRFRGRAVLPAAVLRPVRPRPRSSPAVICQPAAPPGRSGRPGAPTRVGLGDLVQPWLADPHIVLLTLFLVISWKYFGFHMILMLAGLQGIPRELDEAAAIDGATAGRRSAT